MSRCYSNTEYLCALLCTSSSTCYVSDQLAMLMHALLLLHCAIPLMRSLLRCSDHCNTIFQLCYNVLCRFFQGRKPLLVYTGRAHFFSRYRLRGIQHLILYGLPLHPNMYPELVNLIEEVSTTFTLLHFAGTSY
jgi:Utp25, U3 small nucleolar RNA-associated SSU processome protein 25